MDLTTTYLGLELKHPVVASAGPLSQTLDGVKGLADGGASAVVLYSLFEEQLRAEVARDEALIESHENASPEALDYFPANPITTKSAAYSYLSLLERSASALDVPVIASLNGADLGGWVEFARELADAGAAAIELNIYLVPGDTAASGEAVEKRHVEIVSAVTSAVGIPVSVKMSPYFSSPGNMALQLLDAGASGLVLFNRFLQPDVNPRPSAWIRPSTCRPRTRVGCRARGSRPCATTPPRPWRGRRAWRPPTTSSATCWRAPTS
jgi:dihydroorotate dehydrogenase (fumarate)